MSATITPYLCVNDAEKALAFYAEAFGAVETMRFGGDGQPIGHAEMTLDGATFMLSDEFPDFGAVSPATLGGSPVGMSVSVDDVDARIDRAVAAGARLDRPVQDQFYGDRTGTITDPFGHKWTFSTHVEDVSVEEMQRRAAAQGG